MDTPIQVVFRGQPAAASVVEACEREVAKLERFAGHLTSCRVVVEQPQHRHAHGELHEVRLFVNLAGAEVAVTRVPSEHARREHVDRALREAFDAAKRQLQDVVRRRRGHVKTHTRPPRRREAS